MHYISEKVLYVLAVVWAITSLLSMLMGALPKTRQRGGWWLGFAAGLAAFGLLIPLWVYSPGNPTMWFFA